VDHPVTEQVAHIYLDEVVKGDADVLLLGCTHYPLLKPLLRRVAPERMKIVDSAESTAKAVKQWMSAEVEEAGSVRFFATDSVEKFRKAGEKFMGRAIENVVHVELES